MFVRLSPALILAAVIALTLVASPAAATPWGVVAKNPLRDGPVLGGEEIFWTERDSTGLTIYRASAGTPAQYVARPYVEVNDEEGFQPGTEYNVLSGLAAAPGTVAYWLSYVYSNGAVGAGALFAGPTGESGPSIVGFPGDDYKPPSCSRFPTTDLAVAPDAVVFTHNFGCDNPSRGHVILQALPKAGDPVQLDPGALSVGGVKMAGRWVAWRRTLDAGSEVAVYDRTVGAIAYKVADLVTGYDVDEDGRLATVRADGTVAWYSPADPTAHVVALDGVKRVAASGGRIGYERPVDGGTRLGTIGIGAGSTGVNVALVPPLPPGVDPAWDFDGQRMAWKEPGCLHRVLRVQPDVTATSAAAPLVTECRAQVRSSVLRQTPIGLPGTIRILVECPDGCSAHVSLVAPRLFRGRRGVDFAESKPGPGRAEIRLAGAVRAEQPHELTAADLQVDAGKRDLGAVALAEA